MKIGTEVALLRFGHGAFDQKLHLLAQPAADDEIVFVEPERKGGPVKHFLSDVAVYLVLQFLGRGWAIPGTQELLRQTSDVSSRHHDLSVGYACTPADEAENGEQQAAQQQEVHQRLAQEPAQHGVRPPQPLGVYQIGEV